MQKEIKETLLAKVYDVAEVSPLFYAKNISSELGFKVYLKREDLQLVHSFKLRGAYNKIANLSKHELAKGVIAASAGNHAQGVALASMRLGTSALIVMPKTTPQIKVNAVKALGADVKLYGDNYSDAAEYSKELIKKTGRVFVHPFDDQLVIAGQGTVGREIIEQQPLATHIFVPVGGGGLIAGIANYVKSIRPDIKIIAVEPDDSNAMQLSVAQNKRINLDHVGIFADGVAVKKVGKYTFNIVKKYVDDFITVNSDQVCAAIKKIFETTRSIVEPAGALSLAGVFQYSKDHDLLGAHVITINSGANMSFERLQFIAERTMIGSEREALYSIKMPEKPGSLQEFCINIVGQRNINQFAYRLNKRSSANVLVGINIKDQRDKKSFEQNLLRHKYIYRDLSQDDIAKEHVRHMIGGPSANAVNEKFFEINFPERPGALSDFLSSVSNKFNISLFHYRGQGADIGSVLIGFESDNPLSLKGLLDRSGYDWRGVGNTTSLIEFIK